MSQQFEQFLIFYKQLANILEEMENFINDEKYNDAINLLQTQNNVIKKIIAVKANVKFSQEEELQIQNLEQALNTKKTQLVNKMEKIKINLQLELNKNNTNEKLNTAYTQEEDSASTGGMIDLEE